jgi:hypothetical protein
MGLKEFASAFDKLREITTKLKNAELHDAMGDLYNKLGDLKMENGALKEKYGELLAEVTELRGNGLPQLVPHTIVENCYRFEGDEKHYCAHCYEANRKKHSTVSSPNGSMRQCNVYHNETRTGHEPNRQTSTRVQRGRF